MRHSDMYFCSGVQNSAPSTKTLYIESHLANNLHNLPYKLLERQKVVVERYVGLGCVLKCSMYTPCNRLQCSLSKCQPRCLVYIIWFVSLGLFVWMTVNARHQIKLLRTYIMGFTWVKITLTHFYLFELADPILSNYFFLVVLVCMQTNIHCNHNTQKELLGIEMSVVMSEIFATLGCNVGLGIHAHSHIIAQSWVNHVSISSG